MSADVRHGDCMEVMRGMADNSVDAVVTDPPYNLSFMGKAWDGTSIAFDPATWRECLRVLKPGGHLLSFGGTRTSHRMACAIEDAGFEIRDSIAWLYGSGFPKSRDIGKDMDRMAGADREVLGTAGRTGGGRTAMNDAPGNGRAKDYLAGDYYETAPATGAARKWEGWGTALKPAHEPIIMARKPFAGTVAANVLTHGTGAINVDATRIEFGGDESTESINKGATKFGGVFGNGGTITSQPATGRWPANVALDEDQAAALDEQSGTFSGRVGMRQHGSGTNQVYGTYNRTDMSTGHAGEPDTGGASRFFYVAKAGAKERPKVNDVSHPTVKPLELMRWLIRMITPPGGTVLDPFAGSGTTLEAALMEGFDAIGIESEADYIPLIHARLERSTP